MGGMKDLFDHALGERMRPRNLAGFVGLKEIFRPVKTILAMVIANQVKYYFETLSAVLA